MDLYTIQRDSLHADYPSARLHLLTERKGQNSKLLFALVELLPHGVPAVEETYQTKTVARQRSLVHGIVCMPFDEVWQWYCDTANGQSWLPGGNVQTPKRPLETSEFVVEPPSPSLALGGEWPFLDTWHSQVRAQFLLPPDPRMDSTLSLSDEKRTKLGEWLQTKLGFDLLEQDWWWGAVALIAPNPVYRSLESQPVDCENEGGEKVVYRCIPHLGQSLDGVTLNLIEKRDSGWIRPLVIDLKTEVMTIQHPHIRQTEAMAVVCKKRGLLEWHGPLSFFRQLHMTGHTTLRTETVVVPPKRVKDSPYSYRSGRSEKTSSSLHEMVPEQAETRQQQATSHRRMTHIREMMGSIEDKGAPRQYWFSAGEREKAVKILHNLIRQASREVWFIDPYFGARDLTEFALRVEHVETQLFVLTSKYFVTSAEVVGTKSIDKMPKSDREEQFCSRLNEYVALGYPLEVRIASKEALHDRFLVIDGRVWLLGNSFNRLGENAGMMVLVEEPDPVLIELQRLFDDPKTEPLAQ